MSLSLALARSFLAQEVTVAIDRALGSRHPRHGFLYPVNYGCLPGVRAPDGEDLDAYVLGVAVPLTTFSGRAVAIVHREDDDDDKLVVGARKSGSDRRTDYGRGDVSGTVLSVVGGALKRPCQGQSRA